MVFIGILCFLFQAGTGTAGLTGARLVRVDKLWDHDPHNAFTDLIRWKDQFICSFRAGTQHVSPDGELQLLSSKDGLSWEPLARIRSNEADLRDPKLILDREGNLLVISAGALHDQSKQKHQTFVWSSRNGKTWSEPLAVGEPDSWIWRVAAHQGRFYGWGYGTNQQRFVRLYRSEDGRRYEPLTGRILTEKGYPNETAMVMDGTRAWSLMRRDGQGAQATGLLGQSAAPFREWKWKELDARIGGPAMIRTPRGELVAVVRLYSPTLRTAVCLVDPQQATIRELLTLPSGGDCSYAGVVWHDGRLWISYYSSHEGRSSIYLAQVELSGRP
jgi:hypothetical protein